jgi:hypothetical protein
MQFHRTISFIGTDILVVGSDTLQTESFVILSRIEISGVESDVRQTLDSVWFAPAIGNIVKEHRLWDLSTLGSTVRQEWMLKLRDYSLK